MFLTQGVPLNVLVIKASACTKTALKESLTKEVTANFTY